MVRKYCKLILFIAAVLAAVLYLPEAWWLVRVVLRAFKPVFVAVFLALVFHIPINFLYQKVFKFIKKDGARYAFSLAVVYVLVLGLLALAVYFIAPEFVKSVKGFAEKLPEYAEGLKGKLSDVLLKIGLTPDKIENVFNQITAKITAGGGAVEGLFQKIKGIAGGFVTVFFALILSVYILLDRKRLIKQIRQFSKAIFTDKVYKSLNRGVTVGGVIFAKFLGGQFIEAILLAVLTFLGMLALSLPYALLVSVIVFVCNLIPMLGAYLAGALGFLLIAFVSFKQAVIFIVFSIILQQFENNVTYPKVVGNSLGLSGFWVMASVLVGGALFGFWGIMIGVPAVAVVCKLLGYRLKKDNAAGALIPEVLKQPDQPAGGDGAEQGGDKGNGDGAA